MRKIHAEFIMVFDIKGRQRVIPIEGQPNPLNDDTFICKYEDSKEKWRVVDRATGMAISHAPTKKECIRRFIDLSSRYLEYKEKNPHYQKLIAQFKELREKEVAEWQALVN